MKDTTDSKYTIPILQKGFEILELLTRFPNGLPMQEIINTLQIPKTTVFRLLNSLTEWGYLSKNRETQHFFLSKKLLKIGLAALGETNIVEQSLPPMRSLRDRIKESVMLGIFMENKVVLLEQVLGSHNFTFLLRPGTSFCLHASAPGKIFLAHLTGEEQEAALQSVCYTAYNAHTITSEKQMLAELEQICQTGYAADCEEEMAGVHCIAAPVFNQFGGVAATIWTSGPSGRLTEAQFPETANELIKTADLISQNLGYNPTR